MDHNEMEQKIIGEIEKTEQLITDYKDLTQPISPDDAIGRISRMDAINNKTVNEAALRQAQEKLRKLHYVLKKLGSDDFGICVKCGQPIPLGRILIKPESVHCVKCAR
ncbi:MAG: TraR/DksA C4-type zinc finger protein [Salinivirgaceae bacterium]|jgi:DnaK suppressor protein|nr:TraR/DksA C4-type zinc finger protein [Salinivirgaceae bacterium]